MNHDAIFLGRQIWMLRENQPMKNATKKAAPKKKKAAPKKKK
jgi:hypothetical protein